METAIEKENPSQICFFLSYCYYKDNRPWYILYYLSLSPSMNFSQESSLAVMKGNKKKIYAPKNSKIKEFVMKLSSVSNVNPLQCTIWGQFIFLEYLWSRFHS